MVTFPPVEPGDPVRLSATTFAVYESCPESAAARLRGEYAPDTRAGFSGGLAHRLFARHLESGPIPSGELPRVCREEIGSSTLNIKLASLGLKPSGLERVVEEVGALYERFRRMPDEGFAGAEVLLELEPAPEVLLVGSIDAVFHEGSGGPRLVDWKTGEIGDMAEAQLRFYALLWALAREELPGRVEAVSVRTGERLVHEPTEQEVETTSRRVAAMVGELRHAWAAGEGMERRGGPWCRFCALVDSCPEGMATVRLVGSGWRGGSPQSPASSSTTVSKPSDRPAKTVK